MPIIRRSCRLLTQLVLLSLFVSTCSTTPDAPAERTLYEELGGGAGVEKLTADFIREIAVDDRIKGRYRDSDIGRFHRMMIEQMCMETGGGCTYTGDDMQRTHAGSTSTGWNSMASSKR